MDTTYNSDGRVIVLHGKPKEVNVALKRLRYSWNPDRVETIDNPNHPLFDNTLYINVYGIHGGTQMKKSKRRIQLMGHRRYEATRKLNTESIVNQESKFTEDAKLQLNWMSRTGTIAGNEDTEI